MCWCPPLPSGWPRAGERKAATVASQIGLYLLALSLFITAAIAAAATPLTGVFYPGFSDEAAVCGGLLRVLADSIVGNSLVTYQIRSIRRIDDSPRRRSPASLASW